MEGSVLNKVDLLALYLSETNCHKTSTRPPSCWTPQQPTINESSIIFCRLLANKALMQHTAKKSNIHMANEDWRWNEPRLSLK